MSQYPDSQFFPHSTRMVIINLAAGQSDKISEVELFNRAEPDIYIRSKEIGSRPPPFYKNQHILVPLTGPTILTISLIVLLFIKADVIGNMIKILQNLL